MVTRVEGTPREVAEKVSELLARPTLHQRPHAIALVVVEDEAPPLPQGPSEDEFQKLMAEGAADTVAVGHMDDSREAMYTRMPGE